MPPTFTPSIKGKRTRMNKPKIYSSVLAVVTTILLWYLIDSFVLDLAFPKFFDPYTSVLPAVALILLGLLDHESKKAKAAEQAEEEVTD